MRERERERERERDITYSYDLHFARVHARTHIPMDVPKFQERINGMICTLQLKNIVVRCTLQVKIKFVNLFLINYTLDSRLPFCFLQPLTRF